MTWVDVYICINVFIIGSLFGSFFSLANYRIPRKKDIVCTRSFCPKCGHNLSFFDLIPILSYVFSLGKCRYCKEKISPRYLILEIGTGLIFLAAYLMFGFSIYFFIAIIIATYLIMTTGCYLNKRSMLKSQLESLNKTEKKAGVFITEIVIAAIILAIAVGSTYSTYNSTTKDETLSINNSRAAFETVKNVELALSIKYDDLSSFTSSSIIDGIVYTTTITVSKYSDSFVTRQDYIKIINARTDYVYNGVSYSYEMETLKKKVI